ncbi:MAG: hypothetical protein IMZ64_11835 [Bacteroidetes bacterium]|nr:hypothetical protein [Bacteroidota bacterium]
MSLIDSSYFVGEINIPNPSGVNSNATAIAQAITQYEKEILIQLLGYKLYSLLVADCTGEGGVPVTQIYIDLVDGAEFTHDYNGEDITLKWEGLKNAAKQSLIAYYTYYMYVEREVTHLSQLGIVLTETMKGQRASSAPKMIAAWERMRELYGKIPPDYKKFYPGPVLGTNLSYVFNCDPSAYNFLFANKEDYPDWIFTPQWNINAFGI